jgi:hypothetical protein
VCLRVTNVVVASLFAPPLGGYLRNNLYDIHWYGKMARVYAYACPYVQIILAGSAPKRGWNPLDLMPIDLNAGLEQQYPACPKANIYNLSTEDLIALAQSREYTHNNIGWKPVTSCRASKKMKRTFRMPNISIPASICDVTYPGTRLIHKPASNSHLLQYSV